MRCGGLIVLGILLLVGEFCQAQTTRSAATQSAEDAAMNAEALKKLDRTLPTLTFDAVRFADVIDFLRDVSGAGIVVRWEQLKKVGLDKNTQVTVKLGNVKFGDALTMVLVKAAGKPGVVGYTLVRGHVVIIPVGDAGEPVNLLIAGAKVDGAMQTTLNQKLTLTYDDVGLADILDHLQNAARVRIVVPWDKLKAAGVDKNKKLTLKFQDEIFGDCLSDVLVEAAGKPGDLAFTVEKGEIVVVVKGTLPTRSK
jgi:hypothetical protein